jgi:hypothetical protein
MPAPYPQVTPVMQHVSFFEHPVERPYRRKILSFIKQQSNNLIWIQIPKSWCITLLNNVIFHLRRQLSDHMLFGAFALIQQLSSFPPLQSSQRYTDNLASFYVSGSITMRFLYQRNDRQPMHFKDQSSF